MITTSVHSLIITSPSNPSILVLCPDDDLAKGDVRRFVPILMGYSEANQIGFAMKGSRPKRPMTHDLFMDALTNLDTTVSRVEIHDVVGKVFYSHLVLQSGNRIIEVDARPSDAVSLAIRQNAPIYVSQKVIDASSITFTPSNEGKEGKEIEEFHSFIEGLNPEDFLSGED